MRGISPTAVFLILLIIGLVTFNPDRDDFFGELGSYVEECSGATRDEAEGIRFIMSLAQMAVPIRRRNYFVASIFETGDFRSIGFLGMLVHIQLEPDFTILRFVVRNCDP